MRFILFSLAFASLAHITAAVTKCGITKQPQEMLADASSHVAAAAAQGQSNITINVFAHVAKAKNDPNNYTQAMVRKQVAYMNTIYNPHGFRYKLINTTFNVRDNWAYMTPDSRHERRMKRALRRGTYADLNLYFLTGLANGILGTCNFPTVVNSTTLLLDGCMVQAGTMPGGTVEGHNLGGTTIHEIGHWHGLIHVFGEDGSCTGPGDHVADTPAQIELTQGCPKRQDSCPKQPGLDNIHNFMDYSNDECFELFTAGQERRMHAMWAKYRAKSAS